VQLVENLQREGLHELEEAEGYEELMKLKKINADAVADMVGKSRSYVYARTKLLALCPEIRKDFYAGQDRRVDRARDRAHQQHDGSAKPRAIKERAGVRESAKPNFKRDAGLHPRPLHAAAEVGAVRHGDEKLLPKAGSCTKCPKRTGNQADLFGDVKNADVCTDTKCFDDKRQAHFAGARKHRGQGQEGHSRRCGEEAMPHWENGSDYIAAATRS
jgi:ParB-like chromosome segregation protein Spo0J